MLEYAKTICTDLNPDNVVMEPWARDSFENVFFSELAYFRRFGIWPTAVHIVSWPFKANRFYLIACGLRLADGRFFFRGDGDLVSQHIIETVTQANVEYEQAIVSGRKIVDPLHRGEGFAAKRVDRMPSEYDSNAAYIGAVKNAYERDIVSGGSVLHPISTIIDAVEKASPGEMWRQVEWPW